jgi:DNA-binding HxlR family transcriptional regulator
VWAIEHEYPNLGDTCPLPPAVLDIMLALDNEELHGDAIKQEIGRRTKGQRRLDPGTLYRSLKQMQKRGLLEESEERPEPGLDDECRRDYRLTALGRRVALAEVERLEGLVWVGVPRASPRAGGPQGQVPEMGPWRGHRHRWAAQRT